MNEEPGKEKEDVRGSIKVLIWVAAILLLVALVGDRSLWLFIRLGQLAIFLVPLALIIWAGTAIARRTARRGAPPSDGQGNSRQQTGKGPGG